MKKYRIIIAVILVSHSFFGQVIGVERTTTTFTRVDGSTKVYDAETDKKLSHVAHMRMARKYPNFTLVVKNEDEKGNPLSYYFIKDRTKMDHTISAGSIKIKRTDINNQLFDLNTINSKYSLIILQLDVADPHTDSEQLKEVEEAALSRGAISVVLTDTHYEASKDFAQSNGIKSVVIPNARNLMDKFKTNRFPMYYILDENDSIISTIKYAYEVEDEFKKLD